jgi:lysyl endopeptidase
MKTCLLTLLCLTITEVLCVAQIETGGGFIPGNDITSWYEIAADSGMVNSLAEYRPDKDEPFQFAIPIPVNLTPENSGSLIQDESGTTWTIGIRSKSAKSLNLLLEPFHIPEGAFVYVYDRKKTIIRGAFMSDNNNKFDILPVMPVPGEEIILEYHLPPGIKWKGTIGISQVAYDYLGLFEASSKDSRFNLSQVCNVDINCPEGSGYEREKRAVCRIIVGGVELCTGVLINNTNQQNIPLLITAQHCITNNSDASKSIFVFGYESPWCDGPDGRVVHSLSGSELLSSNVEIDFSLVRLNEFPPFTYKPYFAGWDISGTVPLRTATIHHPKGDVKKITTDLDPPVTGTFTGYLSNGFWRIIQWDSGTTEGGSSGAPLLDENHRVVGILTGGFATCGRSMDDYFAKLKVMCDVSSVTGKQLITCIDPAVSGLKKIDGRDPYAPNLITVDTLTNILPGEQVEITPYPPTGYGYSTGYNSDSLVMYAEYFRNPAGKDVSEVIINLAKVNVVSSLDSAKVFIFSDGQEPGNVIASQKIFLDEAKDQYRLNVDFKNVVTLETNFYAGWKIWYKMAASDENRQFAVFHSPDRINPDNNTAWFNDGITWRRFTEHPFSPMAASLDVQVVLIGNAVADIIVAPADNPPDFIIYPNPASDRLIVSSERAFREIRLNIFDQGGRRVKYEKISNEFPGNIIIDISALKPGIYYVSLASQGKRESHKLILVR